MPDKSFVGRKAEIDILHSQWVSHGTEFMVALISHIQIIQPNR